MKVREKLQQCILSCPKLEDAVFNVESPLGQCPSATSRCGPVRHKDAMSSTISWLTSPSFPRYTKIKGEWTETLKLEWGYPLVTRGMMNDGRDEERRTSPLLYVFWPDSALRTYRKLGGKGNSTWTRLPASKAESMHHIRRSTLEKNNRRTLTTQFTCNNNNTITERRRSVCACCKIWGGGGSEDHPRTNAQMRRCAMSLR